MISLGSDNHSGVHPQILTALNNINTGHAPSYGTDPTTVAAKKLFKKIFGEHSNSYFVFNGSAANVLCLKSLIKSHHAILCAGDAHLNVDECGAPEQHIGCKVIHVNTPDAKLTPEAIEKHLIRRGDQHYSQIKVVSLTLPTELGTMYSFAELEAIKATCKKYDLFLHIDGARFIYAPYVLQKSMQEICSGVDALSFGGTKNGMLFGEAVVLFGDHPEFKFIRKQTLQLPSKMRFLAAQFLELFGTDLHTDIARNGVELAKYLESKLLTVPELRITQKVQANSVFVEIPQKWVKPLREKFFFYIWNETTFEARLMLSFDSTKEHIDAFYDHLLTIKTQLRGEQHETRSHRDRQQQH